MFACEDGFKHKASEARNSEAEGMTT